MPGVIVDRDLIAALYTQCAPSALRFAYLLTGDRDRAEDLVQDAFLKMCGRKIFLRDEGKAASYLRTVLLNEFRKQTRPSIKRTVRLTAEVDEGHELSIDNRDEVVRPLQLLPARQRAAVVCRHYLQMTEAETASYLRCAPGTVKSLTAAALENLRLANRGARP